MKFGKHVEYMLKAMVEHNLLAPIPKYIVRDGAYVKVNRPHYNMRKPAVFDLWRQRHREKLPAWVMKIDNPDIFYYKLWDMARFLDDLTIAQELPFFLDRYDKGLRGEDTESEPAKSSDNKPAGGPSEAEAAFAAAAAEGEQSEAEAAFAAAAAEGEQSEAEAAFAAAAAEGEDDAS